MSADSHRALVDAILGIDPARLGPLYELSAEFHASIETMARVLPVIVGALADDAERAAARMAEARRLAATRPSWSVWANWPDAEDGST